MHNINIAIKPTFAPEVKYSAFVSLVLKIASVIFKTKHSIKA